MGLPQALACRSLFCDIVYTDLSAGLVQQYSGSNIGEDMGILVIQKNTLQFFHG